jgi:3-hydroxyisobutyrate dehydrogenase-like beta-hydroxyacid dehydrogenase
MGRRILRQVPAKTLWSEAGAGATQLTGQSAAQQRSRPAHRLPRGIRACLFDIGLALDTGRQLRVPVPTADRAAEILTVARQLGYEGRDIAALFQVLE